MFLLWSFPFPSVPLSSSWTSYRIVFFADMECPCSTILINMTIGLDFLIVLYVIIIIVVIIQMVLH